MNNAEQWIEKLDMVPLPEEGGMYKEFYRSKESIPQSGLPDRFSGKRNFSTSIYYLLKNPEFSAFHRIKQDEIWHFYEGSTLTAHIIDLNGNYLQKKLGRNIDEDESLQVVLHAGWLFAAAVAHQDSYSLIGCTVAPGFEFEDFTAPSRNELLETYPQHKEIIMQLTQ